MFSTTRIPSAVIAQPTSTRTPATGLLPLAILFTMAFASVANTAQAQTRVTASPPSDARCPDGWKPAPGVNPVLRCLPDTVAARPNPQKGGPGHGDPGQPREVEPIQQAFPDLVLIGHMQLANASIAWGSSATVSADDAAFKQRGRCGMRYAYATRNQGLVDASATENRIRLNAKDGPSIGHDTLPLLAPNTEHMSSGHVLLKPGTWTLYAHADDPQTVAESDEANNLRRVRVTVEGRCT